MGKLGQIDTTNFSVNSEYHISMDDNSFEAIEKQLQALMSNEKISEAQLQNLINRLNLEKERIIAKWNQINEKTDGTAPPLKPDFSLYYGLNQMIDSYIYGNIYLQSGQLFEYLLEEMEKQKVIDKFAMAETDKAIDEMVKSTGSKKTASYGDFTFDYSTGDIKGVFEGKKQGNITAKVDVKTDKYNLSAKNLNSLKGKTRLQSNYLDTSKGTMLYQFLANDLIDNTFAQAYLSAMYKSKRGEEELKTVYQEVKNTVKSALFTIALTGYGQESGGQTVDYLVVNDRSSSSGKIVVVPVGQLIHSVINQYINHVEVNSSIFKTVNGNLTELTNKLQLHVPVSIKNLGALLPQT